MFLNKRMGSVGSKNQTLNSTLCYCPDCRKAIGAQSVAWVTLPVSDLKTIKGKFKEYESSPGVFRGFCEKCGTSLSYRNTNWGDKIDVATSTLDRPEEFQPKGLVYPSQKVTWDMPGRISLRASPKVRR